MSLFLVACLWIPRVEEIVLRKQIRIGTRGSALALWQAEWVKAELEKNYPDMHVPLVTIKTTGDMIVDVPLAKVGGKGLFVKEIEEALLSGVIDIAVHSMKDVPTLFPEGLHLGAITMREDPRDVLIARMNIAFKDLPKGARIGTSSLRRQAQLMHARSDLVIHQLRGNVDTRIRKLREGQFDAIVLAAAGVKRLGLAERITEYLSPEISLPAIGQGSLGIECRADDRELNSLIAFFDDQNSRTCVMGERALLRRLEGGCQVPIACYGEIKDGGLLYLTGLVASVDGKRIIKDCIIGYPDEAEILGVTLAEQLLSHGADDILREVYGESLDFNRMAHPLSGKRIVITRSREQARAFASMLADHGAIAIEFPTIDVVPPASWTELDNALNSIGNYDWIMFTSANAVNFFMERLQNLGKDIDILTGTSICCIGPKTAEAIGPFGLKADLVPADFKAEGVLAALGQLRVKGQKFLFPRAKEAREILPDRLRELGAEVTVATAYENVKPVAGAEHVKKLFEGKKIDVVTFTSPSTVRNFVEILGQKEYKVLLADVRVACIGPITAKSAKEYGIKTDIMPTEYTIPALIEAMAKYLKNT